MTAIFRRLGRAARRLDDSWLGDLFAGLSLFVTFYLLIFFVGVLQ